MGNIQDTPKEYITPNSIEEIIAIVKNAKKNQRKIRVVGSGHSWSKLVPSGDILLSLNRLTGIEKIDKKKQEATVYGGTKIWALANVLFEHGWGMENFGDINRQSIAGAISTGTHGSGIEFGSLSTQVTGLEIITANGVLLECSEEKNIQLFQAARVSLGLLGIIVKVKLRIVPAHRLKLVEQKSTLDHTLNHLEEHLQNRHFEFYWFPGTKFTYLKTMNTSNAPINNGGWKYKIETLFIENYLLWLMCNLVKLFPSLANRISSFSGKAVQNGVFVNYNHLMLSTPRLVTFTDMEYAFPIAQFKTVIQEIEKTIHEENLKEHFPIVCRFVKGDDIYLSHAYNQDMAYISLHNYGKRNYPEYFNKLEQIFIKHNGRPHWGKFHSLKKNALKKRYPKWDDFMEIRKQLDPDGIFVNDYLKKLLEIH